MTFTFIVQDILAALAAPFNPELLMKTLSKDNQLARLFGADAGVWEGYTIQAHSLMALRMFEQFQVESLNVDERSFFRLFLALHDIGKPLAIEQTGEKSRQSEFTVPILRDVFTACGFEEKWLRLAVELENQDLLGLYLKDMINRENVVNDVKNISLQTGLSIHKVFEYVTVYYQCDAGAYTEFAGGKYALDYLFEVDEEKKQISFSNQRNTKPHFAECSPKEKIEQLTILWSSSIDSTLI